MAKFKHYILTRYNVYLYQLNPYKVQDLQTWERSRVPLFKKYLASLRAQTSNEFTIVLSMDSQTPDHNKSQVITLLEASGLEYVICWDDKPKAQVIKNPPAEPWVITTRLDSDDTVMPEFVETIQSAFNFSEELLDVRGLKFDGQDFYRYSRKTPGSPFISLVEPTTVKLKTAAFKKHSEMKQYFFSRFVGVAPLFVQNIHGGNIINAIRGEEKIVNFKA